MSDPRNIRAIARALAGRGEGLLHGLTSAAAFPASGLAGLHELIGAGLNKLKPIEGYHPDVLKRMQDVNQAMTYEPRTEEGKRYLEESASAPAVRGLDWLTHELPQRAGEKLQDVAPGWMGKVAPGLLAAAVTSGLEFAPNLVGEKKPGVGKIPWDEMGLQEARAAAQRGEHLARGEKGTYIGGPKAVDSPQALSAARGGLDKAVEGGAFGADWYERARKAISEVSGSDPAKADQLSKMLALYSPQQTPDVNMGHALKQINDAVLRGSASRVKPFYKDQAVKGRAILRGEERALGPKVDVYEEHINPNKADQAKVRGVNDVWMGRAHGYTDPEINSGFSNAQHSYMTGENLRAAERAKVKGLLPEGTDPNVGNVQAAAWVGKRYDDLVNQKGNMRMAKALRDKGDLEGALALDAKLKKQAGQSYDTVLPKYTAAETYEQVPGRNTGHLKGAADLPYAQKQELTRALGWAGEGEHDPLYKALGMYDRPGREGEGFFTETVKKPTLEPALVDPKTGEVLSKGLTHANALMNAPDHVLDAISSGKLDDWDIRAFLKHPEGRVVDRSEAGRIAASFGNTDRILDHHGNTGDPKGRLASEDLLGHNPLVDVQVTDKNPNFTARPMVGYSKGNTGLDPASESLLNQTNAYRSAMDAQAAGAWHAPEDAPWLGDHYKIGNYQELPWGKEGSGQVTDWLLGKVDPRVGEKLHTPEVSDALVRKNFGETQFAGAHNFQVQAPRVDLQQLRGMVAEHGLEGVRAKVKAAGGGVAGAAKLGLPAVALTYLGMDEGEEQPQ